MSASESSSIFTEFTAGNTSDIPLMHFQTRYQGVMLMYADLPIVADYLNRHEGWFCRCAQPMTAEPFSEHGYILTVGQFGKFGYEVEPKIAVLLDPPEGTLYRMYNVPVPEEIPQGYAVDYKADMNLSDVAWQDAIHNQSKAVKIFGDRPVPETITQVNWQLHLQVMVQFPKFIHKLPKDLLKSTGDRLLSSIVSQISPRLTAKVQKDFHDSLNLPTPPKSAATYNFVPQPVVSQQKEDINSNAPSQSCAL